MIAPAETAEPLGALTIAWRLVVIFLLVAANGFFVAAEFALVGARRTRIEALVRSGSRAAKFANHAIHHLDHYISGTQLGITLSSLALGWIGETTLAAIFMQAFGALPEPWNVAASHVVAGTIAFAFITFLHIVLGELAPKSIALLFPEATSMALAAPLIVFSKIFRPFIKILNGTANLLLRGVGLSSPSENERVHRPEEIEMLAMQAYEHGGLAEEPLDMIRGVFDLSERTVADVMVPRASMVAVPTDATVEDVVNLIEDKGFVRIPVYNDSLDDIKGILLVREWLWQIHALGIDASIEPILRPPLTFTLQTPIHTMIELFRTSRSHLAIVLDENLKTAGIVSFEDVLEEIVGDIRDEFDLGRGPVFEHTETAIVVSGLFTMRELQAETGWAFEWQPRETVAAWAERHRGHTLKRGDAFVVGDYRVTATDVSAERARRIRVERLPAEA